MRQTTANTNTTSKTSVNWFNNNTNESSISNQQKESVNIQKKNQKKQIENEYEWDEDDNSADYMPQPKKQDFKMAEQKPVPR